MNPPLSFLWKRLKALFQKRVERVRHNAGKDDFHSSFEELEEDEDAFLFLLLAEELFD